MQETWVRSLGQEDPLEEEMATLSSIFARIISWTEDPGGLPSMEPPESDTAWWLNHHQSWSVSLQGIVCEPDV